jgi:hypothetical protein
MGANVSGWSAKAYARRTDSVQVAGAGKCGGEQRCVNQAILFVSSHVTQQALFATVVIGWVFVSEGFRRFWTFHVEQ